MTTFKNFTPTKKNLHHPGLHELLFIPFLILCSVPETLKSVPTILHRVPTTLQRVPGILPETLKFIT